jgi:hypothetical protein
LQTKIFSKKTKKKYTSCGYYIYRKETDSNQNLQNIEFVAQTLTTKAPKSHNPTYTGKRKH